MQIIYLAGGCFWGVQGYFDLLGGVCESCVGYANSNKPYPSYQDVCGGDTNATEAVRIIFDEDTLSLNMLLQRFFSIIDPTALNHQGNDWGSQYRSGIYLEEETFLGEIQDFITLHIQPLYAKKIVTEVNVLENFYPAEEYHQKYLQKNPNGYCHICLDDALKPL
ncbi:peptide-methionine (S)-S-oxide reductase [Helicobacter monodelphidis]|uniref:peptide-methionine (S)-S-oxide reductase MsrA n=1 Tax=Helicobacter sp. 15-1451 TaxID=2004995 RepID=UPI000DCB957F|nr:peptide-methionine (S)-S-oxide reductase MsrA [Helicobacter sp. 15-1451]RAX57533.1 peptide-methionine (S)-S-oxide reductase [Helicobacter sp. 15-1451]